MNEPKSRREMLEAAWDEAEGKGEEIEEKVTPQKAGEGEEYEREAAAAKRSEEETSEEGTPKEKTSEEVGEKSQKAAKETPAGEETKTEIETETGEAPLKAPISWRGDEKSSWGNIPRVAQQAILRRELETQQALSKSGHARRFVDEFTQVISPYSHLIRAQGSTPLAAVDNLCRTAAGLMTGNEQQKAAIVAEIVGNYAVNVEALDMALQAAQRGGPTGNPNYGQGALPPQFAAALKPIYDFMGNIQQQRQTYDEHLQEQANEEIDTFGVSKPFFQELRGEMADLMEFAASKGRKMTLQQAYDRALDNNPELKSQVRSARTSSDVSQAASTLARARKASSSVKGSPSSGGSSQSGPPKNRREALERAWDQQMEDR